MGAAAVLSLLAGWSAGFRRRSPRSGAAWNARDLSRQLGADRRHGAGRRQGAARRDDGAAQHVRLCGRASSGRSASGWRSIWPARSAGLGDRLRPPGSDHADGPADPAVARHQELATGSGRGPLRRCAVMECDRFGRKRHRTAPTALAGAGVSVHRVGRSLRTPAADPARGWHRNCDRRSLRLAGRSAAEGNAPLAVGAAG